MDDKKTVFQNQNQTPNPWVPSDVNNQSSGQDSPSNASALNSPDSSAEWPPQNKQENPFPQEENPVSSPSQDFTQNPSPLPQENPFVPPSAEQELFHPKSDSPPPPPPPSSFFSLFSLGNLIKIGIGIIVLIVFILLLFKVVPGFFNKDNSVVTINYWGLWEDAPTMNSIISDFERTNPNIKVNYLKQDVKQYRETLSTRIQNGNGPDIYLVHNTWLPMFKDMLIPVPSDVLTKEDFSKNFYPVAQGDLLSSGAIYAIPSNIDVLSMYVNNNLFDSAGISAPANWQDFITASRQLTVKDQNGQIQTAGAALGTFDNIDHAPDIISMLFAQNGADLSNLGNSALKANDALTFYTSFAKGEGSVWDDTLDASILAFEKGNLAMYFGYSWDYFLIKAANPNLSFSIVPVPVLPGQNQTIASYWANGVSVKSAHQKEALLFLKFLSQKETQQKLYSTESKSRAFGQLYPRVDLAEGLKENPITSPFINQAKNAVSSYFVSDTYDNALNSQMNTYLGNAVRSIMNNSSVESAVETLVKGQSQILGQYGK